MNSPRLLHYWLLPLFFLCGFVSAQASERFDMALSNGEELTVDRYPGDGQRLLLWIPPEEGFGPGHEDIAQGLSATGVDVWVLRLHTSFMLIPGSRSLEAFTGRDLLPVLARARSEGFSQVFLMSSRRGARLALKLGYHWQRRDPGSRYLRGLVLFSPHLTDERLSLGRDASYQPIAAYSNLPLYLMIPEFSTKYARSREIARRLEQGGSPVFVHLLEGVRDQFHLRPEEDLAEADLKMRQRLPAMISVALELLSGVEAASWKPGWEERKAGISALQAPGLYPVAGNPPAPSLRLQDLNGQWVDLSALKGQVVLVNFWATWCAPCVEEMPSLSRLAGRLKGRPFRLLAVNIGEDPEAIRRFLARIPVDFEILMDAERQAVRDWKVYAYPSNFLIDSGGRIRYGYKGALDWDAPNIQSTIESLF